MTFKITNILFIFLCLTNIAFGQELSLEDIFLKNGFRLDQAPALKAIDTKKNAFEALVTIKTDQQVLVEYYYPFNAAPTTDTIWRSKPTSAKTGHIDQYIINAKRNKLLLFTNTETIYRHSSHAKLWLYDLDSKKLTSIHENDKLMYPTFNPDGDKLAFVLNGNIFIYDIRSKEETQVTFDGDGKTIFNGQSDWVYEEELELLQAYEWNPEGSKIAFIRFNLSKTPNYPLQVWGNDVYPKTTTYPYPKAGEPNALVSLWQYEVKNKVPVKIWKDSSDQYIPRIAWANEDDLGYMTLDRKQQALTIFLANTKKNQNRLIYQEKNERFVEVPDVFKFFRNEPYLLLTTEQKEHKKLLLTNYETGVITTIESAEIAEFVSVNEKEMFAAATVFTQHGLRKSLHKISLTGAASEVLSDTASIQSVVADASGECFYIRRSQAGTAPEAVMYIAASKKYFPLQKDYKLQQAIDRLELSRPEFTSGISDTSLLNLWVIKPKNFNENTKYPVLFYVYGGPGIQTVTDHWGGSNYLWFQVLANKGYVIVSVDGRGTGGRGTEFKKCIYGQLGELESTDLINIAKKVKKWSYVDSTRIGVWGWSFGGYLTSLAMCKSVGIFKTGIAVAPVTDWHLYDNIYTERYLGLPKENGEAYIKNSPIALAANLWGKLFLIHGTEDDNVHVQNSFLFSNALITANKQFQTFYYPDRNHGIYGGNTRYHLYKMMTDYILNNL